MCEKILKYINETMRHSVEFSYKKYILIFRFDDDYGQICAYILFADENNFTKKEIQFIYDIFKEIDDGIDVDGGCGGLLVTFPLENEENFRILYSKLKDDWKISFVED